MTASFRFAGHGAAKRAQSATDSGPRGGFADAQTRGHSRVRLFVDYSHLNGMSLLLAERFECSAEQFALRPFGQTRNQLVFDWAHGAEFTG
jgi:hypothetical protein